VKSDVVVKRVLWFLIGLGAALLAASALGAEGEAEKAAAASAEKWLARLDAGAYGETWKEGSTLFRKALTQAQWESAARAAREPLGKLLSRKLPKAEFRRSLPGAPDGQYVVLLYESSFEKKQSAVETVTPMKDDDGVWRVSGYYIR
jgi:hypothetical protein